MPRVWLLAYDERWTYGFNARAVARELADRYEIRVASQGVFGSVLRGWQPDLFVDFWWMGRGWKSLPGVPMIKQVSSHRWAQDRYGALDAATVARLYLRRASAVIVPSQRLCAELEAPLAAYGIPVYVTRKGFDPQQFCDQGRRRGPLAVGWAGHGKAPDKRLDIIRAAWPDVRVADHCLTQSEMSDFYNDVDVLTIASDAEGDPRPLIEGMACGCFPVTVDVGVVPELVIAGDEPLVSSIGGVTVYPRGIVVDRNPEAFSRALAWCEAHLDVVRAAGRRNAELMLAERTWRQCAGDWARAFDAAIDAAGRS